MSYLFQGILFVLVLACVMMAESFWSCLKSEKDFSLSALKSIAVGGGFIIYAGADYLWLSVGTAYPIL